MASVVELAEQDRRLRAETALRLMESGVTIYRPDTCVIDAEVEVAPGAIIEPYVQLLGRTKVGPGSRIRSFTVIENCTLGSNVTVLPHCVFADSAIEDGAILGPFSRLRPECEIGEEVHIGNFVEIKKSRVGKRTKVGHLAYVGDAEVGEGANIGAGVITCNYDGVRKHRTVIGNGVFVGSDSALVAPVEIADGAYIGAGSTITKNVPAGALAVGRARQVTKEGWVEARRARRELEKQAQKP